MSEAPVPVIPTPYDRHSRERESRPQYEARKRLLPRLHATALDQRRAFIAAYLASDDSIADLARRFRVSRKTAHKFINRYERLGDAGLHDLPALPAATPAPQTPQSPR